MGYDPIVFSSLTPPQYHLEKFEKIARSLHGYTHHCTFSFVDFYGKTSRNLQSVTAKTRVEFYDPPIPEQQAFVGKLLSIASIHGMTFNSCCNDDLVIQGVHKNHCIDDKLVQQLLPNTKFKLKAEPTRDDCGCVSSVDIGSYDTCLFGCSYCYATNSREVAFKRISEHDSFDTVLWRPRSLAQADLHKIAAPLKK